RLSLGRNPTKLNPGLRLAIPLYHNIQTVDIRETSVDIHDLAGFTSDNVPVLVSRSLFYRVDDSYNACFSVNNFKENVRNIDTSAIRSIIGHFTYDDVIGDRHRTNIKLKLHETIGSSIEKWGVQCPRFEIQTFRPLNRDIEKQLELQMAAERERRKQLLDTQALVNVAEGQKQRMILESEGALQAELNRAEGQKGRQILESEGALAVSMNQGQALAQQMNVIADALTGGDKTPSSETRMKALDVLVELRRLEQLKAIATGSGNTTYFLDSLNVGREPYDVDNLEKWKQTQCKTIQTRESIRPEPTLSPSSVPSSI
ncbi:hypothetical protein NEOLEDRAFT_1052904, partial [Neolentinus lepideus HHB14362 ss-1]